MKNPFLKSFFLLVLFSTVMAKPPAKRHCPAKKVNRKNPDCKPTSLEAWLIRPASDSTPTQDAAVVPITDSPDVTDTTDNTVKTGKKCDVFECDNQALIVTSSSRYWPLHVSRYDFCEDHLEELSHNYKFNCIVDGCSFPANIGNKKCKHHMNEPYAGEGDPEATFVDFEDLNSKAEEITKQVMILLRAAKIAGDKVYIGYSGGLTSRLGEHRCIGKIFDMQQVLKFQFPNPSMGLMMESAVIARVFLELLDNKDLQSIVGNLRGGGDRGTYIGDYGDSTFVYSFAYRDQTMDLAYSPNLSKEQHIDKLHQAMDLVIPYLEEGDKYVIFGITTGVPARKSVYRTGAENSSRRINTINQKMEPFVASRGIGIATGDKLIWDGANFDDIRVSELLLHAAYVLFNEYYEIRDKIITKIGGGEVDSVGEGITSKTSALYGYFAFSSIPKYNIDRVGNPTYPIATMNRNQYIKSHFKNRIPVDQYTCSYCEQTFVTLSTLNGHVRNGHNKRMHICPVAAKFNYKTPRNRGCEFKPSYQKQFTMNHIALMHPECAIFNPVSGQVTYRDPPLMLGNIRPTNLNLQQYCPNARPVDSVYKYHIQKKYGTVEDVMPPN